MATASKLVELFRRSFDQANKEKAALTTKLNDLLEQGRKIEEQVAAVSKELAEMDENIAVAAEQAAKDLGIPLEAIKGKGRGRPPKAAGKAGDADVKTVLRAIPKGKAKALTSGQIAKAAGCSTKMASTILKQLVADKTIKASGERRARRYWKLA